MIPPLRLERIGAILVVRDDILPGGTKRRVLPSLLEGGRESCSGTSLREVAAMITILVIILVIMLLGGLPAWPYSRNWGFGPSGLLGLVLLVILVLFLLGRI